MTNNPKEYDVVLGGQNSAPINSAEEEIKRVKQRLSSFLVAERIAALSEALKYDEEGLEILLQALNSNDEEINFVAYKLLKNREELKIKIAVSKYLQYYWLIYCNGLYCTLVRNNCYNLMKFYPDGTILSVRVLDKEQISKQKLIEWFNQNKNDENEFIYKIENNNINIFTSNTLSYCGKLDTKVGKIVFYWEFLMFDTSVKEYQFFYIPDLE